MQTVTPYTFFATPERSDPEVVLAQAGRFRRQSPLLIQMLDAMPDIVLVLNTDRQIVFANKALLSYLNCNHSEVLGLRPGEALDCVHSHDETFGCGTSEFCRMCGAGRALVAGVAGRSAIQECRITRACSRESLDLRVWASPIDVSDEAGGTERWVQFVLTDVSHEKRRRALEQIFFHDVLNTATAVKAAADIAARRQDPNQADLIKRMQSLSGRLIDEIVAQRVLSDAEDDELEVKLASVPVARLLVELAESYAGAGEGRQIILEIPDPTPELVSDVTLLRRVVGNMLKNAVEATRPGEVITLGVAENDDEVELYVHNPGYIPRDIQLQIFQRSFSTKGRGRGLGTYSMRLLSERYLSGCVGFTSSEEGGTRFWARYPKAIGQRS